MGWVVEKKVAGRSNPHRSHVCNSPRLAQNPRTCPKGVHSMNTSMMEVHPSL
jgi:hypothetical protein